MNKWTTCVAIVVAWSGFGTACYLALEPGWSVVQACYFTFTIISTVGYGCIGPSSLGSRWFTAVYAAMSFPTVAAALGGVFAPAVEAPYARFKAALLARAPFLSAARDDPAAPPSALRHYGRVAIALYAYAHGVCCFSLALATMLVSRTRADMFANALAAPGQTSLDFFDALYFTLITSLTVGFGDVCPQRDAGRAFTVVMAGVGIAIISLSINEANAAVDARALQLRKARVFAREVADSAGLAAAFDRGADGSIDRAAWLIGMLRMLELAPDGEVAAILARFDAVDADRSGTVSQEELRAELDAHAARLKSARGADADATQVADADATQDLGQVAHEVARVKPNPGASVGVSDDPKGGSSGLDV